MATNKTLHVTYWTRLRDLIKGIVLYGSVNWRRASDELKPPKLTPHERKIAMPAKNLDVIRPRENPQAALVKSMPKKVAPKIWDVTAGAIVSDPIEQYAATQRSLPVPPPVPPALRISDETSELEEDAAVVVRRRRRQHRHGLLTRRAPRSSLRLNEIGRPGLFARLFGSK